MEFVMLDEAAIQLDYDITKNLFAEKTKAKNLADEKVIATILAWLEGHRQDEMLNMQELDAMLNTLQCADLQPAMFRNPLELLFAYLDTRLALHLDRLAKGRVPPRRRQREEIQFLQMVLDNFASAYEWLREALASQEDEAVEDALMAERITFCLANHLYVSYLAAAPAGQGVWRRLHRAGLKYGLARPTPFSYRWALLLAAVQPVSFMPQDLAHVTRLLIHHADDVVLSAIMPRDQKNTTGIFWLSPGSDAPSFAFNRREPLPIGQIFYFDGAAIARKLKAELPENAGEAGRERRGPKMLLARVVNMLASPGKRRFPRRRHQSELRQVTLFIGLDNCWQRLCQQQVGVEEGREPVSGSQWMIVNESPDGYALMLMKGKPSSVHVGDVVILRPDSERHELACLVRWVQSENPEHLEIGLQIAALQAVPAMALVSETDNLPVLWLSPHPPVRATPAIIAPCGALHGETCRLRLETVGEVRQAQFLVFDPNNRIELITIAA
jgi:hypothetical protein